MAAPVVKALFFGWNGVNNPEGLVRVQDRANITHFFLGVDFRSINYDEEIFRIVTPPEFTEFVQTVRQMCSDVKILFSVGTGDPSIFARIASDEATRQQFVHFITDLVRGVLEFDGLHLRWLYPVTAVEMAKFGLLLTEFRQHLPPPLLLTSTVFYSSEYWQSLEYPIQAIVDKCDWINVKGFDLYTPDSSCKLTGPPAPLYNPTSCELSGDTGVRAWIRAGVEANKLVLGLPFYGHEWRLVNENNHEIFSPANRAAPEIGDRVPYSQILDFIRNGAVHKFDPSYVTDYCYSGTTWIGYDGEDSVQTKVRYAKKKELRGYIARWHGVGILDEDNWNLQVTASDAWDNA